MEFKTILTSKGTTTIPVKIRQHLGIKPGMQVTFTRDESTGNYVLKRSQTIQEIRTLNKLELQKAKTSAKTYHSGDGLERHIDDKFGIGNKSD